MEHSQSTRCYQSIFNHLLSNQEDKKRHKKKTHIDFSDELTKVNACAQPKQCSP